MVPFKLQIVARTVEIAKPALLATWKASVTPDPSSVTDTAVCWVNQGLGRRAVESAYLSQLLERSGLEKQSADSFSISPPNGGRLKCMFGREAEEAKEMLSFKVRCCDPPRSPVSSLYPQGPPQPCYASGYTDTRVRDKQNEVKL